MLSSRHAMRGAILSVLALLLVACLAIPSIRGAFTNTANNIKGVEVHYFNDDVQNDGIDTNDYNFGPNRYVAAVEAVESGAVDSVQDYIAKKDGTGDFFESIAVDPALCAAIAVDMDEKLAFDEKILKDEQNELIGQRANKAHLHFLKRHAYWERVVKLITERLTSGEIALRWHDDYVSSMYQQHDGLEGNKPAVIVRNSRNCGGWFVEFDLGKLGAVSYRTWCGYQPKNPDEYWPVPDKPDIPDNPTPPTPPTPQPTPEPTPPPTPDPTPTPESKDGNAGPQPQVPDNTPGKEDYGGSGNHGPLTETTNESVSPPEYDPPAPPDASAGTQSGSRIVDDTNGETETHGGQDYTVQADDGQNHTDLGEVQQQHSHDTVEEPVKDDGVNEGDLDETAVE